MQCPLCNNFKFVQKWSESEQMTITFHNLRTSVVHFQLKYFDRVGDSVELAVQKSVLTLDDNM